jgi:hypothetical protein
LATTNLISKSLGDVLTESGNGAPDHTSPMGSLYSDKDTGNVWKNIDGTTTWELLNTVAYGEAYVISNSTTATTIGTQNVWTASGVNMTEGPVIGFSGGTQYLTLLNGYDGKYEVKLDATLTYIAGTNVNYEVGISLNDGDPADGRFSGTFLTVTTLPTQHIGVNTIIDLVGGDTLSVDIQNLTDTSNVYLEHAQLFARKVG